MCPKAWASNLPEHVVLRDVLLRGLAAGWPLDVWLQTWIVLQGIRGKECIEEAERVTGLTMPEWNSDRDFKNFLDQWMRSWAAAVHRTNRRAALSHEEGMHQGVSGHHFAETLRCPLQRQNIRELALKLQEFQPHTLTVTEILVVKHLVHDSGIMLRLATRLKEGA